MSHCDCQQRHLWMVGVCFGMTPAWCRSFLGIIGSCKLDRTFVYMPLNALQAALANLSAVCLRRPWSYTRAYPVNPFLQVLSPFVVEHLLFLFRRLGISRCPSIRTRWCPQFWVPFRASSPCQQATCRPQAPSGFVRWSPSTVGTPTRPCSCMPCKAHCGTKQTCHCMRSKRCCSLHGAGRGQMLCLKFLPRGLTGSHVLHQVQPRHHGMLGMFRWFQACLQPAHRAWTSGSRVGEAANPAPEEKQLLRMAVINPTALHGKVPEVLALQADVVFASETSAVAIVQRQLASSLSGHGFKSFFSMPAPPLLEDAAPEHHVRGLATGVAILSRVPARPSLQPLADEVVQTSRLVESFLRIGAMEVRAICVYGIPSCHGNSLHLNNHLLQVALERVRLSRVPAVVAGDWNCDVSCLPAFQGFLQLGYVEAFHAAALRLGVDLPPTCRQSTKNDTALLAPELVSLLVGAEVLEHEALFDSHDPLLLDFAAPAQLPLYARWATPKPWTDFDFSTQELAAAYDAQATHVSATIEAVDSRQSLTRMFCDWAATLERSVDQAIRVQAKAQGSCHTSGLPQAYRGRCQPVRTVSRTVPQLPRLHLGVKRQLRQCRRLRAFRGGVAKLGQSAQPSDALLQQLFNEWEAIKRAKGFDMPFLSWVLTWPCVEFCPVDFPSWEWVNDVMQLVEFGCQALAAQDATRKSLLQAFQIQEDLSLGHSRESFAALRGIPADA